SFLLVSSVHVAQDGNSIEADSHFSLSKCIAQLKQFLCRLLVFIMSINQSALLCHGMDKTLYSVATSGNVNALTKLQESGRQNIFHEITPTRNTALHLAAYHGHLQMVKKLLLTINEDIEAGNEGIREFLTAKTMEGNTAFHEAAIGGHYQVIEVLLEQGPHLVDILNNAGETALFKASEEGHKKIVDKLLPLTSPQYNRRTSDGQSLLHSAVCNRHKGVIKRLIHHNPEILKEVDNCHMTVLHHAAYLKEMSQIAKIVLEKDSSLCYQVNMNGHSALHIAVKEGNVDLVREILNYGTDCIELVDNDGRNALHLAVDNAVQIFERISRSIKTLLLLVMSRRTINNRDNNGKSALDIAVYNMAKDERLFLGIKRLLQRNGGRRTANTAEEITESPLVMENSMWKIQIVSVNAVLIASVAFQAAFTLPQDDPHHPESEFFQMVVICVTLAFCSSIASAVLLMYALYGNQEDSLLLQTAIKGLWVSLLALLLAFGSGIYIVAAPKHRAVAVVALAIVSTVPIGIRIMIFRSKEYILTENENRIWTCLIVSVVGIITNTIVVNHILQIVLACLITLFTMAWITVSTGLHRRIFESRRHIIKDKGFSIWFVIIGSIANALFFGFFITSSYSATAYTSRRFYLTALAPAPAPA
ncbi:hypothetical protein KI387_021326, partial [Taxus chinensis]